mmetsp:Transcript_18680/g.61605  ORF Transcript_18680/g.61605 Transcript_18680/m.61605 type:complete len:491 (-) Transcript_18680:18-1490(-)
MLLRTVATERHLAAEARDLRRSHRLCASPALRSPRPHALSGWRLDDESDVRHARRAPRRRRRGERDHAATRGAQPRGAPLRAGRRLLGADPRRRPAEDGRLDRSLPARAGRAAVLAPLVQRHLWQEGVRGALQAAARRGDLGAACERDDPLLPHGRTFRQAKGGRVRNGRRILAPHRRRRLRGGHPRRKRRDALQPARTRQPRRLVARKERARRRPQPDGVRVRREDAPRPAGGGGGGRRAGARDGVFCAALLHRRRLWRLDAPRRRSVKRRSSLLHASAPCWKATTRTATQPRSGASRAASAASRRRAARGRGAAAGSWGSPWQADPTGGTSGWPPGCRRARSRRAAQGGLAWRCCRWRRCCGLCTTCTRPAASATRPRAAGSSGTACTSACTPARGRCSRSRSSAEWSTGRTREGGEGRRARLSRCRPSQSQRGARSAGVRLGSAAKRLSRCEADCDSRAERRTTGPPPGARGHTELCFHCTTFVRLV